MGKYIGTRWSIPFAGFLIGAVAGFGYAWGTFVVPLVNEIGFTVAEATLPFSVFFVIFALVMVPAGRLQDIIGPRKVSAIGALLILLGFGLAALVSRFPYPWWLVVTFGVIGGVASGMAYACVAPPVRKWFPDRPGLALSIAVMGVGIGAVVFAPIMADYWIPVYGIGGTLLVVGIVSSVVTLFAAWLIRNPPDGWEPSGRKGKKEAKQVKIIEHATPRNLIVSPIFWSMWVIFTMVIGGGMMTNAVLPAYGELILGLTPLEAAMAVSVFAAFNSFGRPIAGYLGDRFGLIWVMIVSYMIQAIALFSFHIVAVTLLRLYITAAFLGWGLAVTLGLFPALTASSFGTKHLGVNYGMVFSGLAVGALAPAAGTAIYDATGSFTSAFIAAGAMAMIGLVLCVILKKKYALA